MNPPSRTEGFIRVATIYGAAALAGGAAFAATPELSALWRLLLADVVATFVVYAGSVGASNTSVYDAYWSVAPPLLLCLAWAAPEAVDADPTRQAILLSVLSYWGARLTWNWARGWTGMHHEDWRYTAYRKRFPQPVFELVNLTGLHFMPTLLVFLALTGGIFAWTSAAPAGAFAWMGGGIVAAGTTLQLVADAQLRAFRRQGHPTGTILASGVWQWSRHPNYFGEITVWWGVWVVGLDAGAPAWTLAGPLGITLLFAVISIPLIERRMVERRTDWAAHVARTRALLPLPRRS